MIIRKPTKKDLPQMSLLWQEAFGDSREDVENFYETAFSCDRALIGEEQKVVAGIYWIDAQIDGQKVAYLYALAVDAACRGRGVGKTLLNRALETLKGEGYAGAVLVPGEEALCAYYQKAGFATFEKAQRQERCAPGLPAGKASPEDYFVLRQKAKPAISWSKEAFSYLGRFCHFYAGDGWLLAVGKEGIQEFLGDPKDLPHILYTLNIGASREKRPAAMACCFEPVALPDTFGPSF